MVTLFAKLFIKDYENYSDPTVRRAYGVLCAILAIALNIALSAAKFTMAAISGSFSIRADAINNLTDASSGLLLLLAFYFAGMRPHPERPFGHGRIEYVAGFIVSSLIIVLGVELGRDSIIGILHPEEPTFSGMAAAVLAISIVVKFYMSYFMVSTAKKINSESLRATGIDSRSDTIATSGALAGLLIFHYTPNHLNLDSWFGLLISLLILKSGIEATWETLVQLLGSKPDPEIVESVKKICMSYEEVTGLHDLVIHDYGPGRLHVSVHCEVPGDRDIYELHDAMDRIMQELDKTIGCESVIHMDPVCTNDGHVCQMRDDVVNTLRKWNEKVMIHDFRIVEGPTHTNVIFDCLVPLDVEPSNEKALAKVKELVQPLWDKTFLIVKIDRPYV